ncbi:Pentatricopeptide repeat-containing protein [Thalictrum thalictroides]|uniref:Pentatricopeptide repeat-containing protein n=1 Tax=Thalictrum thalictroides TaxID=46969 RepID=A0A7J6VPG3_THATH|nr:Pentatricopeptide repeat-containing protein [Thalictrum thalictroides]
MSMTNLYSWNNMLSGYAKQGLIKPARKLFDEMPERDVVSWNTMVIMFAKSGFFNEALGFFRELRKLRIGLNEFSFAGVLIACVKMEKFGLNLTKQVHGQVLVSGFFSNLVLSSSIVDAYSKSDLMSEAKKLFDEMPVKDVFTWTTLVSGYAKLGDMETAHRLFDEIPVPNPVSWTSLISGYARAGLGSEALKLFSDMMMRGIAPDQFTFSCSLCACASIASLKHGKQIHCHLIRTVFKANAIVVSSLIDMYSKCGSLAVGKSVFNLMGDKLDVVLWNTMISALAQHGLGEDSIQLFQDMLRVGTKPSKITLVVILNACSHSGLVDEGLHLFEFLTQEHGIDADLEHYACLVDLLGRAGRFEEVKDLLEKMPHKPDGRVWNALLGASRIHGNIELGRIAAEHLIEIEPQSSGAYVLLSNIFALIGKWESVEKVRNLMSERQVKKEQAISWLEVESKVHSFSVFDHLHPMKDELYLVLEQLVGHMDDEMILHDAMKYLDFDTIVQELP